MTATTRADSVVSSSTCASRPSTFTSRTTPWNRLRAESSWCSSSPSSLSTSALDTRRRFAASRSVLIRPPRSQRRRVSRLIPSVRAASEAGDRLLRHYLGNLPPIIAARVLPSGAARRSRLRVLPRRRRRRGGGHRPEVGHRGLPRACRRAQLPDPRTSSRPITMPTTSPARDDCRRRPARPFTCRLPPRSPSTTSRWRTGTPSRVGGVRIAALATPGHRPEHMAYVISDAARGEEPWLVVTGDSLFVGDVARPDLAVEPEEGARELFGSLHRLLELDDFAEAWPGHIGGSLCGGAGMSEKPGTTIGFERRFNRLLRLRERAGLRARADRPPCATAAELQAHRRAEQGPAPHRSGLGRAPHARARERTDRRRRPTPRRKAHRATSTPSTCRARST